MTPGRPPDKAVEINDLCYSYPDGTAALNRINFGVERGESVGVVGPNGAGKSTLLLHLNGILMSGRISAGGSDLVSVKIMGMAVSRENLGKIRSMVGLVFQDPDNQLFMPTVFEDVAYGPLNMGLKPEQVRQSVERALEQVDMRGYENRLSHHLSFGEKKRVSAATVLSMEAKILALDEPTSNLDPRHRRDLINFLNGLELTRIIASHDLDMVMETCKRVILLDKGRLVADGRPEIILGDKALMAEHGLEVPYRLQKSLPEPVK